MTAIRNALTIDVEDYFQVSAMAQSVDRADWDRWPSRVERNTRRMLELFEAHSARATFFILGWVAERYPGLVREIAEAGHEIASHGMTHELVYRQTPQVFREETRRSKDLLEDIAGVPVAGYRAASYSIVRESLWALDTLVELGFRYDSSIFPVRHDRYGIPDSPRWPHRIATPAGASLIEFPLTTLQIGRYRLPLAGGGYFRLFPYRVTEQGLASVNRREQRPFIFYLHPWEIDPDQPRIDAGWLSRFRHYNNLDRCEARLERLLERFRFGTAAEVLGDIGLAPETEPRPGAAQDATAEVVP